MRGPVFVLVLALMLAVSCSGYACGLLRFGPTGSVWWRYLDDAVFALATTIVGCVHIAGRRK